MPAPDLETAGLKLTGRITTASNVTFLCSIGDVVVVYKPIAGESPLRDFPQGALAHREVAAYLVSQVFEWDVVPHTWPRAASGCARQGGFRLRAVRCRPCPGRCRKGITATGFAACVTLSRPLWARPQSGSNARQRRGLESLEPTLIAATSLASHSLCRKMLAASSGLGKRPQKRMAAKNMCS